MSSKKKIVENWDMIETAELKVKELMGDPEAGFNVADLWFGTDGRKLMLPCQYRRKTGKKGQEKFSKSYKEIMFFAQFCPFSGKPLYEVEEENK